MIKKLITSCLSVLALCHTAFAGEKFVPWWWKNQLIPVLGTLVLKSCI